MKLSPVDREEAARQLRHAEQKREPIDPLTDTHPGIDTEDAYDIQLANIRLRRENGAVVRGHKIGLTSKAMQEMLGVDQPDYGHLLDDMFVTREMDFAALIAPRIEPEVAFVLSRDLSGPECTPQEVRDGTDHVVPALEIIDSRITDWRIGLVDTVADNASSARVVLGTNQTPIDDLDLPGLVVRLLKNGEVAEEGKGAAVLGDPAVAVAWLANSLSVFGVTLRAGHVVLSGSCTRAIPVEPGDVISADIGVLGQSSIMFA